MPGCAHIWERDVFLHLGRPMALQFCPRLPLLESRIPFPPTEVQILQCREAGVDALAVFGQGLAHLRDEAASCGLGQISEEFPGLDDAGLPGLGFVREVGLGDAQDGAGFGGNRVAVVAHAVQRSLRQKLARTGIVEHHLLALAAMPHQAHGAFLDEVDVAG